MNRKFWLKKIDQSWQAKSIVWLMGVRRTGKTTLCNALTPGHVYDCELPRIRRYFEDPEYFFKTKIDEGTKSISIDEIHRLENPSEVLKIAADHFPSLKIIATGSATLAIKKKFNDSLTDRKRVVFLTPLNQQDLESTDVHLLDRRMIRGGLPPFYLAEKFPESGYAEWLDSFWAKDITELFELSKKNAFLKFFELLALQSGGIFEAKSFAAPCGVSHTTIAHYLEVLNLTNTAYIIRPFHKNLSKEIIAAPKIYFFDTGFISFFNGKNELTQKDRGIYWEHLVLNELLSVIDREHIHTWRDKSKNEVDFVIKQRGKDPVAIECKWNAQEFSPSNLKKMRELHPRGKNILVSANIFRTSEVTFGEMKIIKTPLSSLNALFEKLL
jgi:predicted AAA+ superfamily ATPase